MTSDRSTNVLDDIQTLCKDYRRKLKRGETPRPEDYLSSIGESSRDMLFQNLLHIDIEFRRRKGEAPTSEEYIERFPQFGRLIRQAFFESTMMSMNAEAATPAVDETLVLGVPAARKLGEYELLRELGRGGFGVVYAAKHLKRGEVVALKTLPMGLAGSSHGADDAERLHKFRQEFRQLSEVNHPNLVGMQSLEVESNQWFLTMDLVDGSDFLEYVRPNNGVDEARLRSVLKQLVAGIVALHERGIVHRDLKPSNVLVGKDGRVTILDFGLVAELQQPTGRTVSMQSQHFAGTPRYAAPEQAVGRRTAASDWYAMGVMIYEALTGDAPFRGSGMQIVLKKQAEDAPKLNGRADLPADLASLVDELLQRESSARPDTNAICKALGVEEDTVSYSGPDDSVAGSTTTEDTILIGRERQLAALRSAKQQLLDQGEPVAVLVSGMSGEGKTSLIDKFLQSLRREGDMLVLSGRCYDRESVPFKAVDCLVDALAGHLRSVPLDEALQLLPNDIVLTAQLFPALRRVGAISDMTPVAAANLDSRELRTRGFAALRELLQTLSRQKPIACFIDDLQWGDADSAGVLVNLLKSPRAPAILLLGSLRSEERNGSPFLHEWDRLMGTDNGELVTHEVQVGPLSQAECVAYLKHRLGDSGTASEAALAELLAASHGNPYLLEQLTDGYDHGSATFQSATLPELIERRLQRCPAGSRPLLELLAVVGKAVSVEELSQIADRIESATATLTHMRSERLVRLAGTQESPVVDTYHDKIRETTLDRLSENSRRRLHLRIAETIEARSAVASSVGVESEATHPRIFDLAHHFYEARDPRAFRYQLAAGQAALNSYANEVAVAHLRMAEEARPTAPENSTEFQLQFLFANALARCDQLQPAIERTENALALAPTDSERILAYRLLAELHWRGSDYRASRANLDAALSQLGARLPTSLFGRLFSSVASSIRFFLLPDALNFRLRKYSPQELSLLSQLYTDLHVMHGQLDTLLFTFSIIEACVIARHMRDPKLMGHCYAELGMTLAWTGLHWPATRLVTIAKRCHIPDAHDTGERDPWLAGYHYARGELDLAAQIAAKGYHDLRRAGSVNGWCATHSAWHTWAARGNAAHIVAWARREAEIAAASNNKIVSAYAAYGQAEGLSRQGKNEEALELANQAVETLDAVQGQFLCLAYIQKARVLLQMSDYEAARNELARALKLLPKLKLFEITVPGLALFVEAIVTPCWIGRADKLSRRDRFKAAAVARLARFFGRVFPNTRAHAYRVSARLANVSGKQKKSRRLLGKAITAAERIGTQYELARSLIDRSTLGFAGADADRKAGLALLAELGCVLPDAEMELLGLDRESHYADAAPAQTVSLEEILDN